MLGGATAKSRNEHVEALVEAAFATLGGPADPTSPQLRGTTATVRGLGAIASPNAYGHGGVGTSYCWGDPDSGVSFAYITNNRVPDPWHSERLDVVSTLVHAAIL